MFIIQKFSRVGIEKLIDFILKTFKTTASSLNSVAFLFYSSSRLSHPTLLLFSLPFFRIESANGVNDVLIAFDFMSKNHNTVTCFQLHSTACSSTLFIPLSQT